VDFETCDAARLRRDKPFDGLFFAAVRTTRIYCRPICLARPAATRNVSFLPSAPAAEAAGYRPCLRCRPEVAPWCPAWKGTRSTVERALKLIEQGALDRGTASELPRASASGRDTSRACSGSISTPSPVQVATSLRVRRAKRLLSDTQLPIDEVAFAAGFGSVRRFNAVFASIYHRPPSAIRRPKPAP